MKKNIFEFLGNAALMALAVVTGGVSAIAATVNADSDPARVQPEQQTTTNADGSTQKYGNLAGNEGNIRDNQQSQSNVQDWADPDFYAKHIDERIVEIDPYATPIDTFVRAAGNKISVKEFECKVYRVGFRSIKTTVLTANATAVQTPLSVADPTTISDADTLRVVGVEGLGGEDLVLYVVGTDNASGQPIVIALNSKQVDGKVPVIDAGTTIIRMGKAAAESDAQAAKFAIIPEAGTQYLQNFMCQVQQSTIDRLLNKEVAFGFNDVERMAIKDMKRGMELSYLFGVKSKFRHPIKKEYVYTCGGIFKAAAKQTELGKKGTDGVVTLDKAGMVDFMKEIFTGEGVGSKHKVLVCGTNMETVILKMELDKYRMFETVERWDAKVNSFSAFGGTLDIVHSELLDEIDPNMGFVIDPGEMTKATMIPFGRNVLDLKKAGILNADAVVLQEVSAIYLRNPYAFCRVWLKK